MWGGCEGVLLLYVCTKYFNMLVSCCKIPMAVSMARANDARQRDAFVRLPLPEKAKKRTRGRGREGVVRGKNEENAEYDDATCPAVV